MLGLTPDGIFGISIHALREEGDIKELGARTIPLEFLSTPSARRATAMDPAQSESLPYFYPRPPRGGRLLVFFLEALLHDFYPRPPRGGRPLRVAGIPQAIGISIHALREEGDSIFKKKTTAKTYFYPRPPRGGRPGPHGYAPSPDHFYPRPPRGGRLEPMNISEMVILFLSTPSARRATSRPPCPYSLAFVFLSTPSARRATRALVLALLAVVISIHALREEGDLRHQRRAVGRMDFYPRPPRGGRPPAITRPTSL